MELERCYSVLAVSSSLKFNESIRGLLPESRYFPVTDIKSIFNQASVLYI